MTCNVCGPNFYGRCPHAPAIPSPRSEPMPRTIEGYEDQQKREGELILRMKDEISKLKARNDRLEKKLLQRKTYTEADWDKYYKESRDDENLQGRTV